ncbi:hypothetical protein BDN72DRAFT_854238 [Pluteus cervinus]|uniref:Uncharacterized protein n=1 Tax=Pluteus cervinus TaxID=181527 RepID=A0ACD3B939_9AGAR|nr:hypothetical protein BDN72DRAFT_854238 [Pluteus cervinus]
MDSKENKIRVDVVVSITPTVPTAASVVDVDVEEGYDDDTAMSCPGDRRQRRQRVDHESKHGGDVHRCRPMDDSESLEPMTSCTLIQMTIVQSSEDSDRVPVNKAHWHFIVPNEPEPELTASAYRTYEEGRSTARLIEHMKKGKVTVLTYHSRVIRPAIQYYGSLGTHCGVLAFGLDADGGRDTPCPYVHWCTLYELGRQDMDSGLERMVPTPAAAVDVEVQYRFVQYTAQERTQKRQLWWTEPLGWCIHIDMSMRSSQAKPVSTGLRCRDKQSPRLIARYRLSPPPPSTSSQQHALLESSMRPSNRRPSPGIVYLSCVPLFPTTKVPSSR